MHINNYLALFPLISSVICAFVLAYVAIKGEKNKKLLSLIFLLSCVFLWSFGQFLEYSTDNERIILQYTKILHTGVAYLGVACFIFCLYYIDSLLLSKYSKLAPLLIVISTITTLLIYTNELHGLFIKIEPLDLVHNTYTRILGPVYWIETSINYIFSFLSVFLVFKSTLESKGELLKQKLILAAALIVPTLAAMVFDIFGVVDNSKISSFDIGPTSFSISLMLLVVATFKYNFLDIIPITLRKIFYEMKDPVIIIDKRNRVLKYNKSFITYFCKNHKFINADDPISYLKEYAAFSQNEDILLNAICGKEKLPLNHEIQLVDGSTNGIRIYDVCINPVISSSRCEVGRIVTFCDITLYKELAAENERNRIAMEIHDSIGYGLTNMIMLVKECRINFSQNKWTINDKFNSVLDIAENMLNDLRYLVMDLRSDKDFDVVETIDSLAEYVRRLGVSVQVKVNGKEQYSRFKCSKWSLAISDTLYKICREALTNSLRHGKASEIIIILKFNDESINLFIIDNGQGCKEIKKGMGLMGIEKRVRDISGKIAYGSNDEKGFNISINIPLEESSNDKSISC